jgi:hypothetical protein
MKSLGYVLLTAAMLSAATATACPETPVTPSAKVKELQAMLMVGALQCRAAPGSTLIEDYNLFVQTHKGTIRTHMVTLRAYFFKSFGRSGAAAFDNYDTRLANAVSNTARLPGFCNMVTQSAQAAAAVPPDMLPEVATNLMPVSTVCFDKNLEPPEAARVAAPVTPAPVAAPALDAGTPAAASTTQAPAIATAESVSVPAPASAEAVTAPAPAPAVTPEAQPAPAAPAAPPPDAKPAAPGS